MRTVRVTGKTVEEAVAEGLAQLGITRAEAIVHVVEEPSGGLFGLLRRKQAVVDVSAEDSREDLEKAVRQLVSEAAAVPTETAEAEEAAEAAEPAEVKEPEETEAEEAAPAEAETEAPAEETAEEAKKEEADEEAPAKTREERPFSAEEQNETAEEAKKFLAGVFKGMDLDVTMEKMVNEERILLNLRGKGLGILIGKHGQTLNALQYLTNLAAGRLYHHRYFVMLDVENYRSRREQTLTALAKRLAEKAKRTGESVELEPMEPGERRIIHLALQADPDIVTDSEGEGSGRHVVIRLK